jgi:hypothetical protein
MVERLEGSGLFFAKSLSDERPNKRTKACHIRSLPGAVGAPERGRGAVARWRQAKVSTPAPAVPAVLWRTGATGAACAAGAVRPAPG